MTGPTREEVDEWAREAEWSGLYIQWAKPSGDCRQGPVQFSLTVPVTFEQLQRFAALAFAAGARSGEDARDAARYRAVRKWLVSDDPPRYLLESYPVTEDAVDVVIDAAMGGNDAKS